MKEYTTIRITKELKAKIDTLKGVTICDKLEQLLGSNAVFTTEQIKFIAVLIDQKIEEAKTY